MASKKRQLADLAFVGPATLHYFELLGIRSVAQLARANPERLYEKLCRVTGKNVDICCLDGFTAAVAQARNPRLPAAQRQWWYWSRQRKAREAARTAAGVVALYERGWRSSSGVPAAARR